MKASLVTWLAVALLAAGCGSADSLPTPSAPTPLIPLRPLAIGPGVYWLQMNAVIPSTDPRFPCEYQLFTRGSAAVRTQIVMTNEGADWVGRSPEGSGDDLELRFTPHVAEIGGVPVTGSVVGSALDTPFSFVPPLPPPPPTGVRASVRGANGGAAVLEGKGQFVVSLLMGRITGDIRFEDGRNATSCDAATWILSGPFEQEPLSAELF
jgi:hypothetical protein